MDLSRYANLFLTESRDQLGLSGQALLEWERRPAAVEPVVSLFRAMHTFKGMAAAMGYTNLAELAHRIESVLDVLRSDPAAGREHVDLFFRVVDGLERGVAQAVEGGDGGLDFSALIEELNQASVAAAPTGSWAVPAPVPLPVKADPAAAGRQVQVTIRSDTPLRGARALLVLRKAATLGVVGAVRPPVGAFESDAFEGQFGFDLQSEQPDAAVLEALRSVGDVASVVMGAGAQQPADETVERRRQIRMDARRLDAIMNLVGELVVAKGRLTDLADLGGEPELQALAARISRVTSTLYGEVVQARLTPVWQVLDRFPRLVRDLARQLGRRVRFEVAGEDTQLDRAILDEIGEPLLHLLRNAVDHGIEPPEERQRRGKPEEGLIRVVASSDRTTVLLQVSDDGRGIDRARVLESARKAGLVGPDTRSLGDDELLRVLARPGFSTATRVTDVSGRGMGMDAALSRIRQLGGSVELSSVPGQGSTFTLRLPMTLAIVRALLAVVGEERYAIPIAGVAEAVEYRPERTASLEGREGFILREELLPLVQLRDRLGVTGPRPPGRQPAVILEVGERRTALVVDALVGQQEIVVEPFDAPKGMLPVFSGATILGDGIPALIVDPAALV